MNADDPLDIKPIYRPQPPAIEFIPRKANWEKVEWFVLQWAHRAGTVALFALLAGVASAISGDGPYGWCFAAAVVVADVGLIGAILAWWTSGRIGHRSHEPLGVVLFNLIVMLVAFGIYIAGKSGYIDPAVQWIIHLFPPIQ